MQQIKVSRLEVKEGVSKKNNKPYTQYVVHGEDGSMVSTFDMMAASIQAGDVIEAELEVNGKYTNLKSFKPLKFSNGQSASEIFPEEPPQAPKPVTFIPRTAIPAVQTAVQPYNKDKEIAIAVAIKAVTELASNKVIPPEHPLVGAVLNWCTDQLRQYLSMGVTNPPKTDNKAPTPQPETIFPNEKIDTQSLLNSIKYRMQFTTDNSALNWLKLQNHIPAERIEKEPDAVYQELKLKHSWK